MSKKSELYLKEKDKICNFGNRIEYDKCMRNHGVGLVGLLDLLSSDDGLFPESDC